MSHITLGALILAGGQNRRMGGSPKALLPNGSGALILDGLRAAFAGFDEKLLSTNTPELAAGTGFAPVPDARPGMGPLAGLAVPLGHRGKKLVIAAEDNMAQQELTFCTDEILARANSFLEEPYFTECQVKLRLGQKDLLNREEAPCIRPPGKAAASGVWLSEMDPGSPVARCYRAFAARGKDSGQ